MRQPFLLCKKATRGGYASVTGKVANGNRAAGFPADRVSRQVGSLLPDVGLWLTASGVLDAGGEGKLRSLLKKTDCIV